MSYRVLLKTTGSTMLLEAAVLVLMSCVSLIYRESPLPFLITIGILLVVGFPLTRIKTRQRSFFSREGYVTVALVWLVLSAFGALPFFINGGFGNYIACFFEAVSGFTTTGSSVLTDIESLPKGILFWRSTTHVIGGMGILVLVSAIIPNGESRAMHMMRAEMPGPTAGKLVPRLSQSNKILYGMYFGLIAMEIISLKIAGVKLYECFTISFSTAGTGGFAVTNDSLAGYSAAVEIIVSIYMLLFSLNFALYFLLLTGRFKSIWKDQEFRLFFGIIIAAVLLVSLSVRKVYDSYGTGLRHTLFTLASTASTTGFVVTDYDRLWPTFGKCVVLLLTVTGACAGSTGGGIKVSRLLILVKSVRKEVLQIIHPRSVNLIRVDDGPSSTDMVHSVLRFFPAYLFCLIGGILIVSLDNYDFTTSFSAALTCIGNVGPGLGVCGPTGNFAGFSNLSKIVLSFLMLIGRLEVMPILIFFAPSSWRKS